MIRLKQTNQNGFVMTTVIFMIVILSIVAYAALLQSNNGLNLSYKQSYTQMARVASKAAIDYAQEQFNNSACGAYTGTNETDLVSNDRYRLTFRSEVTETSPDGLTKTIKGTGSVYLPKLSSTAKYVFDIRSEVIRTYALCKTPGDYAPIQWLDASDTTKLLQLPTGTSFSAQAGLGVLDVILPNDTIEEKVSDGTQGLLSWLSDDIEMHTCDALEYVLACGGSQASRDLYNGYVFSTAIPKGYTINSASLQLSGGTPSGSGGSVTSRFYGLYNNASNPHIPYFTSSGVNQVKSRITNSATRTGAFKDLTTNNIPPGNSVSFDVKDIVQEMVNNANWSNGTLGFGSLRQSDTGSRKVCKGNLIGSGSCWGKGPRLSVTYSASSPVPSVNNGSVFEWDPVTGWGVPAKFAYGTQPTRVDNQINGKSVVRFNNGTLLSSLAPALSGKREVTVLAVIKPNFASSSTDGRFISGMTATGSNDTTAGNSLIPLLRNGSSNGFSNLYSGSSASNRTDYLCSGACASTPYIFSGVFTVDSTSNTITSTLKGNGSPAASKTGINPSGSPYTFSIDQLYIGGRRSGTGGGATGADYLNGDYAEIVVYDKALECRQIEALEEYFRAKWAISASAYVTTCPGDTIPTL